MNLTALVTAACSELLWWSRLLGRALRRRPGHVAVTVASAWIATPLLEPESLVVLASLAVLVIATRVWALRSPMSFQRWLAGPVQRSYRRHSIRRRWADIASACGLSVRQQQTITARRKRVEVDERVRVSRILKTTADGPRVRLILRPLMGQTVESFERAAEAMRMATAATRVRVEPHGANEVAVTFTIGDSLATPFSAQRPDAHQTVTDSVVMGQTESGSAWLLPVGPHTLVAGMTGAGKGSVFWSFAIGLAPAIRAGLVRLHGIDLKGGMEILMGADLFTTSATDASGAVALLEDLVEQMQARTSQYAGRIRSHSPSTDEPLHVVMIDELAALTAYCPDRDLQRRAEMAINLLCSQGRAPGFLVFACLQDPRKEVIPSRGLFPQMVGLRLKDSTETAMVLGEGALASGAQCHRITRGMPGVGYVVPEDGGYPMRVRAGYASDGLIRQVAKDFPAPVRRPVPELQPSQDLRALRRSRKAQNSEVA